MQRPRRGLAGSQSVCERRLTVQKAALGPLTWHLRLTQRESGVLLFATRHPSCVALRYANQGERDAACCDAFLERSEEPGGRRRSGKSATPSFLLSQMVQALSVMFLLSASNSATKNTLLFVSFSGLCSVMGPLRPIKSNTDNVQIVCVCVCVQ